MQGELELEGPGRARPIVAEEALGEGVDVDVEVFGGAGLAAAFDVGAQGLGEGGAAAGVVVQDGTEGLAKEAVDVSAVAEKQADEAEFAR